MMLSIELLFCFDSIITPLEVYDDDNDDDVVGVGDVTVIVVLCNDEYFVKFGGDWEVKSMAVSSVNGNDLVRWCTGWMANPLLLLLLLLLLPLLLLILKLLLLFDDICAAVWFAFTAIIEFEFCGNDNALWW